MRTAKLPAILLAALVAACTDDAPTDAKDTPTQAQLSVGASNKQRTQSIEVNPPPTTTTRLPA